MDSQQEIGSLDVEWDDNDIYVSRASLAFLMDFNECENYYHSQRPHHGQYLQDDGMHIERHDLLSFETCNIILRQ